MDRPRQSPSIPVEGGSTSRGRKRSHEEVEHEPETRRTRERTFAYVRHDDRRQNSPRPPRSQVDLRRPIMTPSLIDLTADDDIEEPNTEHRGPIRLSPAPTGESQIRSIDGPDVEIIAVTSNDDSSSRRRSSSDVEIVAERAVPRRHTPRAQARDTQTASRRFLHGVGELFQLLRNGSSDRQLSAYNGWRQRQNALENEEQRRAVATAYDESVLRIHHRTLFHHRTHISDSDFEDEIVIPGPMNYEANGYNTRRTTPPYTAPSPPPEGFLKSPEEDDVVICPNCEEELGVGEDELKRTIWITKSCGHVYCGECTKNRYSRKGKNAAKGPLKTKPFAKCVVDGCGKSLSQKNAMIPLYL